MKEKSPIFVAGHKGLVGSALVRRLHQLGYSNLLTRSKNELDLTDQQAVLGFFERHRPEYVFLSAAKVGGIHANRSYPASFIHENLMIQSNVIHASYLCGVKKLMFLGSSCIYPKHAPQPMREEHLLTGELEPTNEPYAIAKIAGLKMCEAYNKQYGTEFLAVMPTNLYGMNDNFDLHNSHVLPALIRKFHEAKQSGSAIVEVWGTGAPRREFLHVDDLASAVVYLMEKYRYADIQPFVNVGTGEDVTIKELAYTIKDIVGFEGDIIFNTGMPDGTPRKLLDISRILNLGWKPAISLDAGIEMTYEWFKGQAIAKVPL